MRIRIVILLNLIFAAMAAWADEKLPVLKVGSDVYSNVTITTVTPKDIYFTSDRGMGNAKLKNLDPELQKHFKYDAAKVSATENKQGPSSATAPAAANQTIDRANAQSIMDDAIARVKSIINQPVRNVAITPNMDVSFYRPGWFHPGAQKPAFKTVDIRASQTLDYARNQYVSSDLNPGVAFFGAELEFNSMTKYFYVDRSLPKKKLTEPEMLEINRLYRIIGTCEENLDESQNPEPPSALSVGFLALHKKAFTTAMIWLVLLLAAIRFMASRRSA